MLNENEEHWFSNKQRSGEVLIFGQDGEPKEGLAEPPDLIGSRFVHGSEIVTAPVVNQRWLAYNHLIWETTIGYDMEPLIFWVCDSEQGAWKQSVLQLKVALALNPDGWLVQFLKWHLLLEITGAETNRNQKHEWSWSIIWTFGLTRKMYQFFLDGILFSLGEELLMGDPGGLRF